MSLTNSLRRFGVLATLTASTLVLAPIPVAQAAGGTCSSTLHKEVRSLRPDLFWVTARCSSLDYNSKARGVMDAPFEVDKVTSWFTRLNYTYTSPKGTSTQGTPRARTEITAL